MRIAFHEAEALQRVRGLQGIVEVIAVVVDPGHAGTLMNSVPQHFVPERFHRRDLGEEAVAADVEAEALVLRSAGDPSHHVIAFEHRDGIPLLGEEIGRGQTGAAPAPITTVRSPGLIRVT